MSASEVSSRRFKGKVSIITGASRGIGLAIAHRLADEGSKVCLTARKPESLREALSAFPAGSAIAVAGKVDDPDHRLETLDTVRETFGRLDVLVNNAGINPVYGPLIDLEVAAQRKIFEANVLAPLAWVQSAYHHEGLGFENYGVVVNVSSVSAQIPSSGIGFYGISKSALEHLTRSLAVELGPEVRVNAVAPAVVKTVFAKVLYEGKEDEVASAYPLRRLGMPDDVASVVAFLASSDATWMTGQIINVDGGLLTAGGAA
ncbi:MAG TPA: SDR family oxidoreductase [Acidimicrobiales bacterium]|nr:SDR family oxidoreductase [Acidimicrobiales bacterium]